MMRVFARWPQGLTALTTDELKREALRMDPQARADLAHELLASLDSLSEAEIERLWLDEAERRNAEIEAGRVTPVPAEEVFAKARAARA